MRVVLVYVVGCLRNPKRVAYDRYKKRRKGEDHEKVEIYIRSWRRRGRECWHIREDKYVVCWILIIYFLAISSRILKKEQTCNNSYGIVHDRDARNGAIST